jgi:hypothetical protein
MKFPLDIPSRYDPHFVIEEIKGFNGGGQKDHEIRSFEEIIENKGSWMEIKSIMDTQVDPRNAMVDAFPPP